MTEQDLETIVVAALIEAIPTEFSASVWFDATTDKWRVSAVTEDVCSPRFEGLRHVGCEFTWTRELAETHPEQIIGHAMYFGREIASRQRELT